VLDDELVEETRRVSGKPTYSAAINEAMKEFVRVRRLKEALAELDELAKERPIFREGYLAEIRPNAYDVIRDSHPAPVRKKKRGPRTR
jgi:Bacterial antitoxin of type II TA system, VapB